MSAKLLLPFGRRLTSLSNKTGSTSDLDNHLLDTPPSSPSLRSQARHQTKRSSSLTPSFTFGTHEKPEKHNQKRLSHDVGSMSQAKEDVALAKDRYQLIFMGAGGVGKTSLISRFLYDKLPTKHKPTVEDMYAAEFPLGNELLTLDLVDTSGTIQFPAMQALNMARGDGFILVYSVTDPQSFEEVRRLREQILAIKAARVADTGDDDGSGTTDIDHESPPPPPIVIVGNKVDDDFSERAVSSITAETIATIDWEHGYIETSALTGHNVSEIFKELLKQSKVCLNVSNMDRDLLLGAAMDRRRRSFPVDSDMPRKRDFQKKRTSCAIN